MARALDDLPRLTLEEFLDYDDRTDTRYELRDGWLYAMNPAIPSHGVISMNIGVLWRAASRDLTQSRPLLTPGLVIDPKQPDYYIPDVAFTCEELRDTKYIKEPSAVAEVLSPGTERDDFSLKLARYQRVPSIEEIWLVGSRERWAQVYRRIEGQWVPSLPTVGRGQIESGLVGRTIDLEELYEGADVPASDPPPRRHRLPDFD